MQIHVIPTLASLCLFAFLVLLGRAFFALVRVRMPGIAAWLLSPAMGLALLTLLVCYPNQAGIPIASYGRGLLVGLAVLAAGVLVWRRCPVPWRLLGALSGLALLWHATAGWPLLQFGNDWVSYVNGDYTNYCIGAVRLLKHGFFASPTVEALGGGDPSGVYWFLHVAAGARPGTDLVLAAASATAGTGPREAFMPVILAFGLTQAWALGGALALSSRFRKAALPATAVLLALPLFGLGIYYQLFAQVGGLALMWLVIAMLVKGEPARGWRGLLGLAATCAVAVAALFLFYPECAPFALLPPAIILFCTLWKKPPVWKTRLAWLVPAVAMTLLLLNRNIPLVTHYFLLQVKSGSSVETGLFPYFLNTDAWAKWLGWAPFYGTPPFRLTLLATGVVIPIFLLLFQRCRIVVTLLCVATVFALMAAMMWHKHSGFGLFKLAMFTQPLLAAGIAVGLLACRPRWLRAGFAAAFVAITIPAWKSYQSFAMGATGGPCEGPYISELGFPRVSGDGGSYQVINMRPGMEKLVALSMQDKVAHPLPLSLSALFWGGISETNILAGRMAEAIRLAAVIMFSETEYPPRVLHYYHAPRQAPAQPAYLMEPHPLLCPFNRLHATTRPDTWFTAELASRVENRLAWQPSELRGETGALGSAIYTSHFLGLPVTPDPANPAKTLGIVGRHLLFSVIHPSPEIYLRVSFTRTYAGEGKTQLSRAAMVTGEGELNLGFIGSGSANVIVGPLKPHSEKGRDFVFLDLGAPPGQLDAGNLTESSGLLRDVSALSPDSYRSLKRPGGITRIPSDLIENPALEYSGIYEDGWVDKVSWVILSVPKDRPSELRISGSMEALLTNEGGNTLSVSIDGESKKQFEIAPGTFDVSLRLPPQGKDAVRVGLEWTKSAKRPGGDNRPTAAWVRSIQLEPL